VKTEVKEMVMAVAKCVTEVEPKNLDWFKVKVDDKGEHTVKYAKRRTAPDGAKPHVTHRDTNRGIQVVLVRDEKDGIPVLRQDGDGLPKKIIVHLIEGVTRSGNAMAGWIGNYEYEQE